MLSHLHTVAEEAAVIPRTVAEEADCLHMVEEADFRHTEVEALVDRMPSVQDMAD